MNPYHVLGVPVTADDQTIRAAYLDGIKAASPDTHPKRFQALNQAYEKIKNETCRLRHTLFNTECSANSPLETLVHYAEFQRQIAPLPFAVMKDFLQAQLQPKRK